jgi:hypothetical protein
MKYIKIFEEINVKTLTHRGDSILPDNNISYFQQDWFEKVMPSELEIYSSPLLKKLNTNGTITDLNTEYEKKIILLHKNSCCINSDLIQFSYVDDSDFEQDEVIDNGEPDGLAFDIFFVKNERGIKMNVDITYGDHMAYEFTLEAPNKINIVHYTGVGSLYDSETHWGFTESSINKLVQFFNRFNHGIKISPKDLKFLDSNEESYTHDKYDKKHLYFDDSNLIDFGNSSKESKIYNFKNWTSFNK